MSGVARSGARLGVLTAALAAWEVPASWVPLPGKSNVGFGDSSDQGPDAYSVPIVAHRLQPPSGYDLGAIGNLQGVQRIPSPRNIRNHAMVVPIAVGTPKQQMTCLLDASSADLWIPARFCESCAQDRVELSSFYDARKSSTFRPLEGAAQGVTMLYGGGKIRGAPAKDTIAFGSIAITDQTFVLAEEGDYGSRSERSWDGVCGIGWGPTLGQPLYKNLVQVDGRMVFQLTPGSSEAGEGGDIGRFFPGRIYGPTDRQVMVWSLKSTATAEEKHQSGTWATPGGVEISGGLAEWNGPAHLAFETGTSYLLVPPERYLAFMRTLLPNGAFEQYCGVDVNAGFVVVCDCIVTSLAKGEIVIRVRDIQGVTWRLPLQKEDLFEQTYALGGSTQTAPLCVPQVQQRPAHADLDSPSGILGSPFQRPAWEGLLGPLAGLLPFGPMSPGPVAIFPQGPADGRAEEEAMAARAVEGSLENFLGGLLGLVNVTEVISNTLRDGTRCETQVVRAINGTTLSIQTKAWDANGQTFADPSVICAETVAAAGGTQRRLAGRPSHEVWVVGHIFMQRYSMFFDFEYGQVGFIRPPSQLAAEIGSAEVEAFTPSGLDAGADLGVQMPDSTDQGGLSVEPDGDPFGSRVYSQQDLLGVPPAASPEFVAHAGSINQSGIFMVVGLTAVCITVWALRNAASTPRNMGGPCPIFNENRAPNFLEEGGSVE